MKNLITAALLLIALVGSAFGAALTTTTFSAAVLASDQVVTVASASGMTAKSLVTNTMLYAGREAMRVVSISSTKITVERGTDGTPVYAHPSGETVYVGAPTDFHHNDRFGVCASADQNLPYINLLNGKLFECTGSLWVESTAVNRTAAGTSVTTAEYGTGAHHVTKATFTDLSLGSVTAANKAIGALLFTLPAGAVVVKSAYMSVALAAAGSTCDADTPDTGLGTSAGAAAVQALLSSVSGSENILTGQTSNDVNGTAETKTVADQVLVIEAAGDHTVYLNTADGWAGTCTITATGTVAVEWAFLQ